MAEQSTGPEVYATDGSGHHTHLVAAAVVVPVVPPVTPVTTLPVLPALTAIGRGTLATQWAGAILAALGAPAAASNTASLIAWFAAEDNNGAQGVHADGAAQNNPLNITADSGTFTGTTGSEPSGAGAGHPGNLNFDTPAHGVAAMAEVIQNYPAIHAALMSGTGLIGRADLAQRPDQPVVPAPVDQGGARGRSVQAEDDLHGGGLTSAVRSEEAGHVSRADGKAQVVGRFLAVAG